MSDFFIEYLQVLELGLPTPQARVLCKEIRKMWQAIEALQNQNKKPLSFADDINPCPPCDCGGITRLTAKVMEQGNYRALCEKEKEKWEKLKGFIRLRLADKKLGIKNMERYNRGQEGAILAKALAKEKFIFETILEKMQELEAK